MLTFVCGYLAGLTTAGVLLVLYWLLDQPAVPPEPPPRVGDMRDGESLATMGVDDNPLTRRWVR